MQGATTWTGSLDLNTTFGIQQDIRIRQSGSRQMSWHFRTVDGVCVCADLEV
jgi:hypothetical protein